MNAVDEAMALKPDVLARLGYPEQEITAWRAGPPVAGAGWDRDREAFSGFWLLTARLLAKLPAKALRSVEEHAAAQTLLDASRASRETFLGAYVSALYDALTDRRTRFVRIDELVAAAARLVPGLTPNGETLADEHARTQSHKDGHEIDQGLLLAHVLADRTCGLHLCHAMLLPHPKSLALLDDFVRTGRADLGQVVVEREGRTAFVNLRNLKYLNAEDESTIEAQELAVDLCTLDAASEIAVLRGAKFETGKYAGRRVYCTGINLTHLYHGKVSYLWYLTRELGWINKLFRGVAWPDRSPDEVLGETREKLWISAVDAFAIGGGCQYLLVMDVNVAASDAYLTLPARKEGIVPGAANLRLPRFVGDRIARQAVMMERRIDCDSPEGRMICDHIVAPEDMDATVAQIADAITRSGVVSASSNRKAFRVAHEPLDAFRRYMAVYAREQAYCHFSPALIRNLEQFWSAHTRKAD
jgi:thioesterase DpgC